MSRAERLLTLLERLRLRRTPVQGAQLAQDLGISLRTLYRDIATLQQQGARIEGEAGIGYVLRPGHSLPPLMFSIEELEALALGTQWVIERSGDPPLAEAARHALAKVRAVLPAAERFELDHNPLLVPDGQPLAFDPALLPQIRRAIRAQRKLRLDYRDAQGQLSERIVWPFALGFFEQSRVLSAWCELRTECRHFRLDRMRACEPLPERYPRPRQQLMREWLDGMQHTADSS